MERRVKDAGLIDALQILSDDLIDYVDARVKLVRLQIAGVVGKAGNAVGLIVGALISLVVAYFLGLSLLVALLARQFGGQVLWPLLTVGLAHLLVASVFVFLSLRSWNATDFNVQRPQPLSASAAESRLSWTTPEIFTN